MNQQTQSVETKPDTDALAARVYAEIVPNVALFTKVLALVVDYYLDSDKASRREDLVQAAREKSVDGNLRVRGFVKEALGATPLVRLF